MLSKYINLFYLGTMCAKLGNETVSTDPLTLKDAAKGLGVYIGSEVGVPYETTDGKYSYMSHEQYNLITAGNACKMNTIATSADTFDFSKCQVLIDYAKKYNLAFRGHNTCWANVGHDWY